MSPGFTVTSRARSPAGSAAGCSRVPAGKPRGTDAGADRTGRSGRLTVGVSSALATGCATVGLLGGSATVWGAGVGAGLLTAGLLADGATAGRADGEEAAGGDGECWPAGLSTADTTATL